jgi:hypothetical protein
MERLFEDALYLSCRYDHPGYMAFVRGFGTWPADLSDFIASSCYSEGVPMPRMLKEAGSVCSQPHRSAPLPRYCCVRLVRVAAAGAATDAWLFSSCSSIRSARFADPGSEACDAIPEVLTLVTPVDRIAGPAVRPLTA